MRTKFKILITISIVFLICTCVIIVRPLFNEQKFSLCKSP